MQFKGQFFLLLLLLLLIPRQVPDNILENGETPSPSPPPLKGGGRLLHYVGSGA